MPQRQALAGQALAGTQPITTLARQHDVSRTFVQEQVRKAQDALEDAFATSTSDELVLLELPVSKAWLRQFVLAVALLGHASFRGMRELLRDRFDLRISLGTLHLENQREALLAFARQRDDDLAELAQAFAVPVALVRELLPVQALHPAQPARWQQAAAWRARLRGRFVALSAAVEEGAALVVRARASVENVNGRLRGHCFLRRQRGADARRLLQFCCNHQRYLRSRCPERDGKRPAALLPGQAHPHGLEMLGDRRFRAP